MIGVPKLSVLVFFFLKKVTECKLCKSYNHNTTPHPTYKQCCVIQCSICGTYWYACLEHNKQFNIANQNKLHSHFVNEHSFPYIQHSMNSSNHSDNTNNIEYAALNADGEDDDDCDNFHTFKNRKHIPSHISKAHPYYL